MPSPAVGTNAAFQIHRSLGTSRRQLKIERYTKFPHIRNKKGSWRQVLAQAV
jgi:hypothetical protein